MGERSYRDQVQRDSVSVIDIPGSVSSYSINGLKPSTQYRFNLTAILGDGRRGPTEQVVADTMLGKCFINEFLIDLLLTCIYWYILP